MIENNSLMRSFSYSVVCHKNMLLFRKINKISSIRMCFCKQKNIVVPCFRKKVNNGLMDYEIQNEIKDQAIDFTASTGAMMGINIEDQLHRSVFTHIPFSLFPSKIPADMYNYALKLAPIYAKMYINVSKDHKFILESLDGMADPFTNSLLNIAREVDTSSVNSPIFGIFRSDYMIHSPDNIPKSLLQVEYNTISCSFGCLGDKVSSLHQFLLNRYSDYIKPDYTLTDSSLPSTNNINGIVEAFASAFALQNKPNGSILFIVQPNENNMIDQRLIEQTLFLKHHIKSLRRTLKQVQEEGRLLNDKTLVISDHNVCIVYYRAGYTPKDYPTYLEWDARLLIEKSNAIKCPNIFLHLSGCKKIQQLLANEKITEKYLPDSVEEVENIRKSYAGLWSLENEEYRNKALKEPEKYVIKPQREGGGNNIYGKDIIEFIDNLAESNYSSYIIMERILPKVNHGYLIRNAELIEKDVVSELGIFSTYIENHNKVINNECTGHIVRTKPIGVDEGGVATGYATLDSPYLI